MSSGGDQLHMVIAGLITTLLWLRQSHQMISDSSASQYESPVKEEVVTVIRLSRRS